MFLKFSPKFSAESYRTVFYNRRLRVVCLSLYIFEGTRGNNFSDISGLCLFFTYLCKWYWWNLLLLMASKIWKNFWVICDLWSKLYFRWYAQPEIEIWMDSSWTLLHSKQDILNTMKMFFSRYILRNISLAILKCIKRHNTVSFCFSHESQDSYLETFLKKSKTGISNSYTAERLVFLQETFLKLKICGLLTKVASNWERLIVACVR